MNETEHESSRLTSKQILALLELTIEAHVADEFQRLDRLSSSELLRETRQRLQSNRLGLAQAARLLAVNELTLKSWFKSRKPLPEMVRKKLAGLAVGLSLAEGSTGNSEATALAKAAVCAIRDEAGGGTLNHRSESVEIILAAFGAVGVMAAAVHSALEARDVKSASQADEPAQ